MITVADISIAPVKALRLSSREAVRLDLGGVPGNRRFFVVDESGRLLTARRAGELLQVGADYSPRSRELALTFPGGHVVSGVARREVDAPHAPPPTHTDFWGRSVEGRPCEAPFSLALSDYLGQRVTLLEVVREGSGTDFDAVTLVSTASLRELAERSGDPSLADRRRYRMLFTLDGCLAREEDGWSNQSLRIGQARICVRGPVPRCAVTRLHPDTGRRHGDPLRAIAEYRGRGGGRALRDADPEAPRSIDFGVYATVLEPGLVRVGDEVAPAD